MRTVAKLFGESSRRVSRVNSRVIQARKFSAVAEEHGIFPREHEGNNYDVNWSLTEDGVVPTGDAFRNARTALLGTRLSKKVEGGKIELTKPVYSGAYAVKEAGDAIVHDAFNELLVSQQGYLSSGVELFIEDAGIGASALLRVGTRVVTDSAAAAIISRTLMVSLYTLTG